jgi:hypothetical protein
MIMVRARMLLYMTKLQPCAIFKNVQSIHQFLQELHVSIHCIFLIQSMILICDIYKHYFFGHLEVLNISLVSYPMHENIKTM